MFIQFEDAKKTQTLFAQLQKDTPFFLSWSHYLQLIRIKNMEEKNDELFELTLSPNANICASEYKLYLPDKKLLQKSLKNG
ncbi:MAG: hypothetical protein K2J93_04380 [Anaeroplasmataceae bacterium]|nr:hypothetical protein [Anaeroplasmataceae bacterium]